MLFSELQYLITQKDNGYPLQAAAGLGERLFQIH